MSGLITLGGLVLSIAVAAIAQGILLSKDFEEPIPSLTASLVIYIFGYATAHWFGRGYD